jgi:hypothetical protein
VLAPDTAGAGKLAERGTAAMRGASDEGGGSAGAVGAAACVQRAAAGAPRRTPGRARAAKSAARERRVGGARRGERAHARV